MIIAIEILLFIALIFCYFYAPEQISAPYLSIVIVLVLASYMVLYVRKKTRQFLRRSFLSNTNIFLLLFFILCFQFPIDYILGNDLNFPNYFYSYKTINLSTTFNALCFVAFTIGSIFTIETKHVSKSLSTNEQKVRLIPTKPILIFMYLLWVGFIIFLNPEYVNGGHGTVLINSISVACYGYFWRLNVIYLAITLYNMRGREKVSIRDTIRMHSWRYWLVILLSALLFFMAHNRVYTFYILTPTFFYMLSMAKIRTKPLVSIAIILVVAVFFTLFKIFGLDNMFSEGSLNAADYVTYDRFSSFSPFTSELAASIFADSTLFYIWYTQGIVVLGSTLVLGVLRTVSGLVPLFFMVTGLSENTYESASYVSSLMSMGYGLGSSVTGDLIVSVGFIGAILIMFLFGRICIYGDIYLFGGAKRYMGILIGLCVSSQIVFVSRSSLTDMIAAILFGLLFSHFYFKFYKIHN